MHLDFLLAVFEEHADEEFIIWREKPYTYRWLLDRIQHFVDHAARSGVNDGEVVLVEADFTPNALALFLALFERGCIVVPLSRAVSAKKQEFAEVSAAQWAWDLDPEDNDELSKLGGDGKHELLDELRQRKHPGLVVFSSGTTGTSKGIVHDADHLLEKFKLRRHRLRTLTFLLFDHLGGINTVLYVLANGGCCITTEDRSPDAVLSCVERHRVELLPVSPTFLNLVLLSEAWKRYDLSTIKIVSYGTEPMPESTLKRFHEAMPEVRLLQTYGLSETGALRSVSKANDSLWVKLGGEGFETRVVDGMLEIKAHSAMLGYLNAESPFTDDGWLRTGDAVEVQGEYYRILGRRSDLINVGGEKVFPAEVENVILQMSEVGDVTVYGEKNPIVGKMVCCKLTPSEEGRALDRKELVARVKRYCGERLQRFQVPVKIRLVDEQDYQGRFKKSRKHEET